MQFKDTKAARTKMLGEREWTGQRFDVALKLALRADNNEHRSMKLDPMLQVLDNIDRHVFRVTNITLLIKHSAFELDQLTELFRLIHGFRDEANVRIRFQMCHDLSATVDLKEWKPLLDLIARKSFSQTPKKTQWAIEAVCGGAGLENEPECGRDRWHVTTDPRLVAACFSALAHAGDHVTSIDVKNPLWDKTSDYRAPRGRGTRARWLGYLLRAGVVDRLTLDEEHLTKNAFYEMAAVFEAPTREECFRLLRKNEWHRPLETRYEDTKFEHIDDPQQFLTDGREVIGPMEPAERSANEKSNEKGFKDVFLVGYGQCSIPSAYADAYADMVRATASVPETKSRLKSLVIRLRNAEVPLETVLVMVGEHLEELTIDAHMGLPLSTLVGALRVCPNLRRLHFSVLELASADDKQRMPPSTGRKHPLRDLKVILRLSERSSGLKALSKWLVWFGIELNELRLEQRGNPCSVVDAALPAVDKMVRTCCRSASIIKFSGLAVDYMRQLYKKGALDYAQLQTLIIECAPWSTTPWLDLFSALSNPKHPLTRSLHTLSIFNTSHFEPHVLDKMVEMLPKNLWLVNFRLTVYGFRDPRLADTNGIRLERPTSPFYMRHKAAFLSGIQTTDLPVESFVVSKIFQFVAARETRRVIVF